MKTTKPSESDRTRLVISLKALPLYEALDLGLAYKDQALKRNGKGRVFRDDTSVQVCLEGLSNEHLDSLTTAYLEACLKVGKEPAITRCALEDKFPDEIVVGECLHENLTKRLLTLLPAGAFLVTNVRDRAGRFFTTDIGMRTDRQRLWEACEEAGAIQRKVWVVWRKEDADAIVEQIESPYQK
jgi:hypothetical protein